MRYKNMKVLSIKEPWASMILSGKKTIETRTWKTDYRGRVLLHASKEPKSKISGKIFAVAKIVNCDRMWKAHEMKAKCKHYPGAYSWFLEDVIKIDPIEINGKLGLWEVDCELILKGDETICLISQ